MQMLCQYFVPPERDLISSAACTCVRWCQPTARGERELPSLTHTHRNYLSSLQTGNHL
jgi:hypothetical protein